MYSIKCFDKGISDLKCIWIVQITMLEVCEILNFHAHFSYEMLPLKKVNYTGFSVWMAKGSKTKSNVR